MSSQTSSRIVAPVKILPPKFIAVDIEIIKNVKEWLALSDILITIGPILIGIVQHTILLGVAGFAMILCGYIIQWIKVHRKMGGWEKTQTEIGTLEFKPF